MANGEEDRGRAILDPPSSILAGERYGSGSSASGVGLTDGGAVGPAVGDGATVFTTGMKGGFETGLDAGWSRREGGEARSTTVISPAAWARYSATSIGRCFFSTNAR